MTEDAPAWWRGRPRRASELPLPEPAPAALETVALRAGRLLLLERHLARLGRTARALGIEPRPDLARESLVGLAGTLGERDALLRLVQGRETIVVARPPRALPARLVAAVAGPALQPDPRRRHKTTERGIYEVAAVEARALGAHEGLLVSAAGELLEGCTTSLFAVLDGALRTAPLELGVLDGVTRAVVLEEAREEGIEVLERAPRREELGRAGELFLTGAGVRLRGIERVLGPGGEALFVLDGADPVTARLAERLHRREVRDRTLGAGPGT